MQSYKAARSLYSFVSGCAQLVIAVGGVIALLGAYYGQQNPIGFIGIGAGFVVALFGFALLVFAQNGRTSVDSAEYAQQNLAVSREQLAISKELLTMAKQPQAGASYQTDTADEVLNGMSFDTNSKDTEADAPRDGTSKRTKQIHTYGDKKIEQHGKKFLVGDKEYGSYALAALAIDKAKDEA